MMKLYSQRINYFQIKSQNTKKDANPSSLAADQVATAAEAWLDFCKAHFPPPPISFCRATKQHLKVSACHFLFINFISKSGNPQVSRR